MNKKWRISIAAALVLTLLGLGGVWAAEAGRGKAVDGQCAQGGGHRHAVMGRITAIEGDKVTVKLVAIDDRGRLQLSMKAAKRELENGKGKSEQN